MDICPVKAIRLVQGDDTYLYPVVDDSSCLACGKCERVCNVQNECKQALNEPQDVYAAISKDKAIYTRGGRCGALNVSSTSMIRDNYDSWIYKWCV